MPEEEGSTEAASAYTFELTGGNDAEREVVHSEPVGTGSLLAHVEYDYDKAHSYDSLIPEALSILGFDFDAVPAPEGFEAAMVSGDPIGGDDLPLGAVDRGKTDGKSPTMGKADEVAKRQRVAGGNQREVQRRYRERQKQRVRDLEALVKKLQARVNELEGEKSDNVGAANKVKARGSEQSTSTNEGLTDDERTFQQYKDAAESLRGMIARGSSDDELCSAMVHFMTNSECRKKTRPDTNYGRYLMHRHATLINAAKDQGCAKAMEMCAKVSGGCLRTCPFPNPHTPTMTEKELNAHWTQACDTFESLVPPVDIKNLVTWSKEYMREVHAIYKRRQEMGERLAVVGRQPGGQDIISELATSEDTDVPVDTLSILDALKASVSEELDHKFYATMALVEGAVQARTAAHMMTILYPHPPDPLGIAFEMAKRRPELLQEVHP